MPACQTDWEPHNLKGYSEDCRSKAPKDGRSSLLCLISFLSDGSFVVLFLHYWRHDRKSGSKDRCVVF